MNDVKDKIKSILDKNTNNDPLVAYKEYIIACRCNEKNSRIVTLKDVAAKLSVVLRNTSNKIMIQKLINMIEDIKKIEKM